MSVEQCERLQLVLQGRDTSTLAGRSGAGCTRATWNACCRTDALAGCRAHLHWRQPKGADAQAVIGDLKHATMCKLIQQSRQAIQHISRTCTGASHSEHGCWRCAP